LTRLIDKATDRGFREMLPLSRWISVCTNTVLPDHHQVVALLLLQGVDGLRYVASENGEVLPVEQLSEVVEAT
jgi:hypothetical protein